MNSTVCSIYIFRHGITEWNIATKFQGHSDIPLHDDGIEQAQELKPFIEKLAPEVILSSDLIRAVQTANIVNQELAASLIVDPSLREFHLGEVEGLTREEVQKTVGLEAWQNWLSVTQDKHHFGFPGGETKAQLLARVKKFIEKFILSHPTKKIGVSCHGGVIKTLCHSIVELPSEEIPIRNCCLYELSFDRKTLCWNFHGALK